MNSIPFEHVQEYFVPMHLVEVLVNLAVAVCLSAALAYRPWRLVVRRVPEPRPEIAHAQVLICAAGAIVVVVVGDSLTRAFGLVGLGAFIRFRAGIKDPRDAASMFLMIGLGMACGLGNLPLAALATGFSTVVLVGLDFIRMRGHRSRVAVRALDPRAALAPLRSAFPNARVLEAPTAVLDKSRILVEIDVAADMDAAGLLALFEAKGVPGVQSVAIEEE